MDYTELSLQERIAGVRGMVKQLETKHLEAETNVLMNRSLKAHYNKAGIRKGGKFDAADQAITANKQTMDELEVALPIVRARLDVLIGELPAEVDEDADPSLPDESDDASPDLDQAPIDTTNETEPIRELSRAEVKRALGGRRLVDTPADYHANSAREPAPV
jgi:hypothetical protein